jgi:hypothetical protein
MTYFRQLFAAVRARPSSYSLDGSYGSMAAFVVGCDQAMHANLLLGFQEWLVVRRDAGRNLGWPTQVLTIALPDIEPNARTLTPEQDAQVVARLFDLLDEFLALSE